MDKNPLIPLIAYTKLVSTGLKIDRDRSRGRYGFRES